MMRGQPEVQCHGLHIWAGCCMLCLQWAGSKTGYETWMWPCAAWRSRTANSASSRSPRVSPMPISRPVVNGTCSAPAAAMVASLASGSCHRSFHGVILLSGHLFSGVLGPIRWESTGNTHLSSAARPKKATDV